MSAQEHKCKNCKHLDTDLFSGVKFCQLIYNDVGIPWIYKEPFWELYEKGITPENCPLKETGKTNKNMYITILNYNKGTVECMEAPPEFNKTTQNEEVDDLLVESGYKLSEIYYMLFDEKPEIVDVEAGKPMVYTEEDMRNACEALKKELALMEEKVESLAPKPKTIDDLKKSILAFLLRHGKTYSESLFSVDIDKGKLYIDKCLTLHCLIAMKNDKIITFDFESDYVVVTVLAKKSDGSSDYDAVCRYLDETDVEFTVKDKEEKVSDAVEFAKWIMKETQYRTDGGRWFEHDVNKNSYSTEELYKQFLEWKQLS